MIDRGWLGDVDKDDIPTIRHRIYRFFGVTGQEELDGLLSHPPAGVMCAWSREKERGTSES